MSRRFAVHAAEAAEGVEEEEEEEDEDNAAGVEMEAEAQEMEEEKEEEEGAWAEAAEGWMGNSRGMELLSEGEGSEEGEGMGEEWSQDEWDDEESGESDYSSLDSGPDPEHWQPDQNRSQRSAAQASPGRLNHKTERKSSPSPRSAKAHKGGPSGFSSRRQRVEAAASPAQPTRVNPAGKKPLQGIGKKAKKALAALKKGTSKPASKGGGKGKVVGGQTPSPKGKGPKPGSKKKSPRAAKGGGSSSAQGNGNGKTKTRIQKTVKVLASAAKGKLGRR